MSDHRSAFKIAIVGCGKVGMTAAYALILSGIPTDLVLHARDREKAEGEKLDLEHALPFLPNVNISATDNFADLAGSDVIFFTAGAAQKPGETRLDLAHNNVAIVHEIVPQILEAAPHSTLVMVTNPVDVLTYAAVQIGRDFGARPGQIFGSGTLLDTARFRFHLSEALHINPRSLHTYILGEHGDSSFPVLSSATVGGQLLASLPGFSVALAEQAYEHARTAAYRVIAGKGATYYAIGTVLTSMARTIQRDDRSVMPVSTALDNYYGVSGVALSVPCVMGRRGVMQPLQVALDEAEQAALQRSADAVRV